MTATVIQLHTTREAKARGVATAVEIAARRMGYSTTQAAKAATAARNAFAAGRMSAARAVSVTRAQLRLHAEVRPA